MSSTFPRCFILEKSDEEWQKFIRELEKEQDIRKWREFTSSKKEGS